MKMEDERPWGRYKVTDSLTKIDNYDWVMGLTKTIVVKPFSRTSLQYHCHRREIMVIVAGTGHIEVKTEHGTVIEKSISKIEPKTVHRIVNTGESELVIYEIQVATDENGVYEEDIIRIEDDYGRVEKDG